MREKELYLSKLIFPHADLIAEMALLVTWSRRDKVQTSSRKFGGEAGSE